MATTHRKSGGVKGAPRMTVARQNAAATIELAAWARAYAELVLDLYNSGAFDRDAARHGTPGTPAHAA